MNEKLEVKCDKHEMTFVVLVLENGTRQLRKQCMNCGKVDGTIFKHSIVENIEKLKELDEVMRSYYDAELQSLYNQRYESTKDQKQIDFEAKREQRKIEYANYLQSYEWKRKHKHIMNKYGYRCILCFKPAVNVHHLTYDRVYLEDERDLVALCKDCHEFVHGFNKDYTIL
jgi:hypothetical protein